MGSSLFKREQGEAEAAEELPQDVQTQHSAVQVLQKGKPCKGETNTMCRFGVSENSGL